MAIQFLQNSAPDGRCRGLAADAAPSLSPLVAHELPLVDAADCAHCRKPIGDPEVGRRWRADLGSQNNDRATCSAPQGVHHEAMTQAPRRLGRAGKCYRSRDLSNHLL